MGAAEHVPVMPDRVQALLSPALRAPGSVLVDATLGLAGHAELLLREHPRLHLIGLDRDGEALDRSRRRLSPYRERLDLVHDTYDHIGLVLARLGHVRVQGVLFDLGVSSLQVDSVERGFAYAHDAVLDMRMDPANGDRTAADVVNTYSAAGLARVLADYGEERFAHRIAAAVVRERGRESITSTRRLSDIVRDAVPAAARRTGGNPAKRTFQALRIEVNGELDLLARALPDAIDVLSGGGRVAVLAYHSLEDRMVKRTFTARATDSTPLDLPATLPGHQPSLRFLTRGAQRPSHAEVDRNPRAAPARLRAAERIGEAA